MRGMGADAHEELLNVYDADGRVVGTKPRHEAKRSGLAVGAVNVLVLDREGRSCSSAARRTRRTAGAGTSRWAATSPPARTSTPPPCARPARSCSTTRPSSRVVLVEGDRAYEPRAARGPRRLRRAPPHRPAAEPARRPRRAGRGGVRNVVYHVAIYAGRTDVPVDGFRPQAAEIDALAWFAPADVDRMLLEGALAPNMAFLWLAHGHLLVGGGK